MMLRTRATALLAGLLALAVLWAGIRWGALVAGGADSYGYVSQAGLWQQGLPIVQQDLVRSSPWPGAAHTWSPLGYRPSPHQLDAIVPLYSPGLPLLMGLFQIVAGYCGAFLVVPLCGALTIAATYALGRRLFDAPGIALWGAALVATSPVFLYQLMNAMSDVPVTAAWALALALAVRNQPLASGLSMGAAIAIRPNLVPLAALLAVWLWLRDRRAAASSVLRFAVGTAPAIAGIAWFNARLYESPLVSGYGTASDLYSLQFFATNARQFAGWMNDVQTPVVLLAGLFFVAPRLFPPARIPFPRLLLGGSLGAVVLSYMFYRPFDAWWYLRFLLPMWPVMMLLTAAGINVVARRWLTHIYAIAIATAAALLAWHGVHVAIARSAFELGRGERRYIDVGRFISTHTDPDAVILSVQHSGSLRLYAGRLTLRYDALDPEWLDRTVEHLRSIGRHPYFVLDGEEVELFRQRFGAMNRTGAVDWTPFGTLGSINVYDAADRTSAASPLAIASTRGRRGGWSCDPPQVWPPPLRMR